MTYDVSRLILRHLFGSRNKPSTFTVHRSILLLCQLYVYIIKVYCHMLHERNLKHMHSIIKPNQPVMEHLGFPSPSCQGSFKAENRENTSKPNKQHVGCWVGNHHDGYPGWFQERGKPQILLIMKLWIKPLVELRCPRRQTKNLWIQLVERLYLILILITCFRHSWVKGYTQSVTWSTACVRYSKGVPLRVVTSCPLLFTPRFQNHAAIDQAYC